MSRTSLGARLATAVAAVALLVVLLAGGAVAGLSSFLGLGSISASPTAQADIPSAMLALYQQAVATCPGLPWTVLAAIGTIESNNGTSNAPGVHSGSNSAGAEGPMQFEPGTFVAYSEPIPPGGADPPSPYDPVDAVYAAARDLCANGGRNDANVSAAIFAYNHADWYVQEVLALAERYGVADASAPTQAAATAVNFALAQVGTPYRWGGTGLGGFDCSGLVQAAYAAAGVRLPRTAQQQYDGTTLLAPVMTLQPGDLVFFGNGVTDVTHVGMVVSPDQMVDAPHTGADVRVEGYKWKDYLGATRPT